MKMKSKFFSICLTCILVIALLLSTVNAYAVGPDYTTWVKNVLSGATVIIDGGQKLNVTYNGATFGKQYALIVVKANLGGSTQYTIDEDNILWISQAGAESTTVTFTDAYPMYMQDCVVLLTGDSISTPLQLAEIDVPITKGDANGDGKVTAADITMVARHVANIEPMGGNATLMTNCNFDAYEDVDSQDLTKLAKYVAGIITTL